MAVRVLINGLEGSSLRGLYSLKIK